MGNKNCTFYYELNLLKILLRMGHLTKKAYKGIVQIAAEDLGATLYFTPDEKSCV